jgi:hypothetical protein
MKNITQREAVYAATKSVFSDASIKFDDGMNVLPIITKELRAKIVSIVTEAFKKSEIEFKNTPSNQEKLTDSTKLTAYVVGLVNNWHRKDKRMNGDSKYAAKNPGSRTGLGDAQLKAMRQLKNKYAQEDPTKVSVIANAIEKRVAQLKAEKAQTIQVDLSVLPEELRSELNIE